MNSVLHEADGMWSVARLSGPLNRIAVVTAILILLTSSFDVFLVLEAGGNFRFCQLIAPILFVLALMKAARGRQIPVLGMLPLIIWLGFQLLFVPTTEFWPKSLGYCFWLLLNIGIMFSFVQLFSDDTKLLKILLKWYVYSFGLLATFGIVQFLLPLLGMAGPLVQQWWIPGVLARANGFSYEPSYFATYLMIGLAFVGSLRRSHSPLLSSRTLLAIYLLTALGVVFSSSRMGIVFLFVEILLPKLKPWRFFFSDVMRGRMATFRLRALIPSFLSIALIGVVIASGSLLLANNPALALLFLNGTGVSDTAAHSVIQREGALEQTVTVFAQHPFVGRSLGGVSSAIADLEGEKIQSFKDSKDFEGMNVFAEALAASGVIGILPFIWFLTTTFLRPLQVARFAPPFFSGVLFALLRSLAFAWAMLQFNQNILRPYLWTHIAVLATVYAAAVRSVNTPASAANSSS
ncbi:MAG TPA: hypothetical protein VFA65_14045 [Bryobacteraceae bacterium]|nr:hypothetical protein [Bryobacteraceae bacterium]